jgi:hypothetical protein
MLCFEMSGVDEGICCAVGAVCCKIAVLIRNVESLQHEVITALCFVGRVTPQQRAVEVRHSIAVLIHNVVHLRHAFIAACYVLLCVVWLRVYVAAMAACEIAVLI